MEKELKICAYTGLELGMENPSEVTEEEINNELDSLRQRATEVVAQDKVSENGDTVNIDFEGFVDGVAFEGGKGEKYDLVLGSGSFIPGFEEQLVGHKAGEEVEVNVTFPEDYHSENLKGKASVFKCKIHEVKVSVVPKLDDAFANKFGIPTFNDLREAVKNKLSSERLQKVYDAFIKKICDHVVANSEISVSEVALDARVEEMIQYYEQSMSQYGMQLEQYLQMMGQTLEAFKGNLRGDAELSCKIDVFYDYVAEKENLSATDDDMQKELDFIKEHYKVSDEEFAMFKESQSDYVRHEITRGKVTKFLVDNNK